MATTEEKEAASGIEGDGHKSLYQVWVQLRICAGANTEARFLQRGREEKAQGSHSTQEKEVYAGRAPPPNLSLFS
jgi:hypothetical protein